MSWFSSKKNVEIDINQIFPMVLKMNENLSDMNEKLNIIDQRINKFLNINKK